MALKYVPTKRKFLRPGGSHLRQDDESRNRPTHLVWRRNEWNNLENFMTTGSMFTTNEMETPIVDLTKNRKQLTTHTAQRGHPLRLLLSLGNNRSIHVVGPEKVTEAHM